MSVQRALLGPALPAVLLVRAAAALSAAAEPVAAQSVNLSGVVSASDVAPIAGATVTVGDQQFQTDDQGHWAGAVAFAPRLREFVSAPGFVADGYRELLIPSPSAIGPRIQDTMRSISSPTPVLTRPSCAIPPTVADFTTNTRVSRA